MIQKKIRSLIYAGLGLILCVLLCGGIGMTAQAAEIKTYEGFTYTENENGITISGYTGDKTELVIPGEIDGKKVTDIGTSAFKEYSSLTSVTIPESVTSIGFAAFWGCSGLTSVIIPEGVTNIEDCAFLGCSGLTSVTIPESVTSIKGRAFCECSGLTSITIPAGVTRIEETAFEGCSGLTSIVVDKENKYYDSRNNCNAIIATESNALVSGCNNTTIPADVTSIGASAFYECSSLTSITIPKGVTRIGADAFVRCSGLTSITIPDSVTSIGREAFWGCSGLTSITLPASVTSIAGDAFGGCSSLTSIKVDKENKYYDSRNNCNAIIATESNTLVIGCKNTTIPASVTRLGEDAFVYCSGLTSITIPQGVTSIGYYTFAGCSDLTSITIPQSVTSIGDYAFAGHHRDLVIYCYKDSAAYEYAMEKVNITAELIGEPVPTPVTPNPTPVTPDPTPITPTPTPTPVTKPATPAKKGTTLTVSSKKIKVKVTSSSKKNPTVTITKFTDKKAKKLTIPATVKVKGVTYKVTAISDKAFKGNKKLTTVTIGSNVTKIGKEAFSGCKNLKKITVTAGKLKTISKNAFKGINKKATITVKGTKKAKTALKKQLKKKSVGYVKTWKIK